MACAQEGPRTPHPGNGQAGVIVSLRLRVQALEAQGAEAVRFGKERAAALEGDRRSIMAEHDAYRSGEACIQ